MLKLNISDKVIAAIGEVLDLTKGGTEKRKLTKELEKVGIRLNKK